MKMTKMKIAILTMLVFLGDVYCQGQQCSRDDFPGAKGRSEFEPASTLEYDSFNDLSEQMLAKYNDLARQMEKMKDEMGHISKRLEVNEKRQEDNDKTDAESKHDTTTHIRQFENELKTQIQKLLQKHDTLESKTHREIEIQKDSAISFRKDVDAQNEHASRTLHGIEKRISEQLEDTKAGLEKELQNIAGACEERVHSLKTLFHKDTQTLEESLAQLQNELKQERDRSAQLQTELRDLNARFFEQLETTHTEFDRKVRDAVDAGEERADSLKLLLRKETQMRSASLAQLENELKQERDRSAELATELRHLNARFSEQLESTHTEFDRKVRDVATAGETLVQTEKTRLQKSLEEQQAKVNIILPNTFNKDSVSLLGIGIVIWLVVLTAVLAYVWGHGQDKSQRTAARDSTSSSRPEKDEPVSPAVKEAICAISFDKNTQELHRKLMEQVLEGLPGELTRKAHPQYRTVLQHDDITRLPATKLYIMFVDYSERHVIIEQPGLGLGDTRRTTVQALERLGGELVMIYMHDLASRRLPSGRRYNRDIYCVKSQPTLKTLNNQGRFFSVYETLTDFQRQSLQSTIDDVFSE